MKRAPTLIIGGIIAAAIVLGVWGWMIDPTVEPDGRTLWNAGYSTLQLFFVNSPFQQDNPPASWQLMVAAYLAPLSLASAFIIALYLSGRAWLTGLYVRAFVRRHVIVAGTGQDLGRFLRKCPAGLAVVVIVDPKADGDVQPRRRTIRLDGSPGSARSWKRAGIFGARAVVAFPGDSGEFWDIPRAVAEACARRRSKKRLQVVMAHRDDGRQEVLAGLADAFASSRGARLVARSLLHSIAADMAECIAPHTVLSRQTLFQRQPHALVQGWSPFVREMLLEAARQYHYPGPGKLRLTVVLPDESELPAFLALHPGLPKVADLAAISPQRLSILLNGEEPAPWPIAPDVVLLAPDSPWDIPMAARRWRRFHALSGGPDGSLALHAMVPEDRASEAERETLARGCATLGVALHAGEQFIDWKHMVESSEVIDGIAERIHGRYAALYGAPPWETLTEREREYNRRSARHLKVKLWCMGYLLEEGTGEGDIVELADPDAGMKEMLARLEHRRWTAEKLLDDFLHGPLPEDPVTRKHWKTDLRIHPDIRPFEELNARDVSKDENTFADLREVVRLLRSSYRLLRDENP